MQWSYVIFWAKVDPKGLKQQLWYSLWRKKSPKQEKREKDRQKKKECTALVNLHQVLLKPDEQKAIKSGLPVLPQLLTCSRGISRLEHTRIHTHSPWQRRALCIFSLVPTCKASAEVRSRSRSRSARSNVIDALASAANGRANRAQTSGTHQARVWLCERAHACAYARARGCHRARWIHKIFAGFLDKSSFLVSLK